MAKQSSKQEGTMAVIAALIVLFSAMWDPWTSVVVALAMMVLYAIWKFIGK
ncbi:MAG: hypothetical protein KKD18_07015 [Nanoarchaeota archaeon]|nr:hypothetical protein [Nanoarchaeota archaeon]MBU0978142.1 hypothetical protein [Nanoarchaeota archaeon]